MDAFAVTCEQAPKPIGPYSHAMWAGDFLFLSGQIALDQTTGILSGITAADQTRHIMNTIRAILASQGLGLGSLVKVTVFLRTMDDFGAFNKAYEEAMGAWKPARSVVAVSGLPRNAMVEVEGVACR